MDQNERKEATYFLHKVERSSQAVQDYCQRVRTSLEKLGFKTYGALILKEGKGLKVQLDKAKADTYFNREMVSGFWGKPKVEQYYFDQEKQVIIEISPRTSLFHSVKKSVTAAKKYDWRTAEVNHYYPIGWEFRVTIAAPREDAKKIGRTIRKALSELEKQ